MKFTLILDGAAIILLMSSISISNCSRKSEVIFVEKVEDYGSRNRHRRESSSNDNYPDQMTFSFQLRNKIQHLNLTLNKIMVGIVPIFGFSANNGSIEQLNAGSVGSRGMYQDRQTGSSVNVNCTNSGCALQGTIYDDDGDPWNVVPIAARANYHSAVPIPQDSRVRNQSRHSIDSMISPGDILSKLMGQRSSASGESSDDQINQHTFSRKLFDIFHNNGLLPKGQNVSGRTQSRSEEQGGSSSGIPRNISETLNNLEAALPHGLPDSISSMFTDSRRTGDSSGGRGRKRRSSHGDDSDDDEEVYVIEIFVAIDDSVYNFFKEMAEDCDDEEAIVAEIGLYYALLINEIDLQYQSLMDYGSSLNLRAFLSGVLISRTEQEAVWAVIARQAGVEYLDSDATGVMVAVYNSILRFTNTFQYDHLMAFSKRNMAFRDIEMWYFYNDNVYSNSFFGGMCNEYVSVSLIQDTGSSISQTAAHELAHSMGVVHDGGAGCLDSANFIMADHDKNVTSQQKSHPWRFSSCSAAQLLNNKQVLIEEYGSICLSEHSFLEEEYVELRGLPPFGEVYNFNETCQIHFGANATFCEEQDITTICEGIQCNCFAQCDGVLEAPTGTACGHDKICYQGMCTPLYQLYPEERCRYKRCCPRSRCCLATYQPWGPATSCCHEDRGKCCVDSRDSSITC